MYIFIHKALYLRKFSLIFINIYYINRKMLTDLSFNYYFNITFI